MVEFRKQKKKFYITTAIPYVNAPPHIGHALEFVQTDAIARFHQLRGYDIFLLTGADENSLKNVKAAEELGISTQQLCDENAALFKELAVKVGLSFDGFLRSSIKDDHWPGIHKLWSFCKKSGDIYKKKYRGLYCVGCEVFYTESELVNGLCPEHKTKPEIVEEENYFFRLSKYQKKLEKLIETDELKVIPESRKHEVLRFIRSGLEDFSISRSVERAKGWGVPVPGDESQIIYVWVDALGIYLTGIGYGTNKNLFEKWWPADVHVIGKGIIRFHTVYWPALLLSAGLPLPKSIFIHGYVTVEGQKMSKSLGNIVDPLKLLEKYDINELRYYLLAEIPTFEDGDFSEEILIKKVNGELVGNFGNFVHRTFSFIWNYFDGRIYPSKFSAKDKILIRKIERDIQKIENLFEKVKLRDALARILAISKLGNRYFQRHEPWKLIKTDKGRCKDVLYLCANLCKILAILFYPYTPSASLKILKQLNVKDKISWADLKFDLKKQRIEKPEIPFEKLTKEKIEELKQGVTKTTPLEEFFKFEK